MTTPISLSKEEREKFAAYLEEDAKTTEGLIEQMKRINTAEAITRRYLTLVAAKKLVAHDLRNTHEF